ncbi:hypothetical protein GCM10009841_31030 [Microlunatus panaciterrae]|uniref:DUF4232 domain-containing protein n=1 Tax=Microlunatus panaciterrae TaxID=400768 RepID=A0ABS2RGF3_9ACTN|nr:hypothetical protein [Microlunatus panaciterrae]MBM7797763.1 hypothetical protein [Microlunatus panaciterrae]
MRKSLVALATSSLIATLAAVGVAPAAAAPTCVEPTILSAKTSPRTVVVGVQQAKGFVLTVKIRSNCTVKGVSADVVSPTFYNSVDLNRVARSGDVTTWDVGLRLNPQALTNADAGTWSSTIWVDSAVDTSGYGSDFKVLRAARLTTNATPEPVRKGRTITVKGNLNRANWNLGRYRGYGKKKVQLQWRPAGGSYSTLKTVTSAPDGDLRTTLTARKDGCFRFVFKGSSTTAPVKSKADCIDVR